MYKFIIFLYYADQTKKYDVEADCYADAVAMIMPGNDVLKVEVIEL